MKPEITLPPNGLFKSNKAYSPEEILAAGGATAFGKKSGKNNKSLIKALKNAPRPSRLPNKNGIKPCSS